MVVGVNDLRVYYHPIEGYEKSYDLKLVRYVTGIERMKVVSFIADSVIIHHFEMLYYGNCFNNFICLLYLCYFSHQCRTAI